ncbi:hypothetical protein GUJ93_ZPchr0012g20161 [Zizania palustris]|uniref:Uncharacterized protein n=1 Tax=Zizania palustris TaxID=103762 RepID=A0A8J6BTC7_ZIZPA|nr:hypothetical protein GUJ93_ZPchr0012g20161 [Zizania palustris]
MAAGEVGRSRDFPSVVLAPSEYVRKACVRGVWIFLRGEVVNHGIEDGLREKAFAESRKEKDWHPHLWEDVHHVDGMMDNTRSCVRRRALIVSIGDLLERWTNCIFRDFSYSRIWQFSLKDVNCIYTSHCQ